MFKADRVLTLDIGSSKLALAEFSTRGGGAPQLLNYGIGRLDIEPDAEAESSAFIVATLREMMRRHAFKPAPLLMTVSGQAVFPRFVKLPPVSRDKIYQIVSYEAEQNVPFPIDEVVWDYQLIEDEIPGSRSVMLVAVKIENVRSVTDCVLAAGLEPEIVDAAPMALYNCVLFDYPDLSGCTVVLDIGSRSSNVIFVEENRIFNRNIPVAGNAITQAIAKELEVPFKEAEELKLKHGFVAFSGVYAGPDNEVADRVSKIVRNVITRLHAEVNRSINFYRGQQGGNPPTLLLLTGGSCVIPHMDTFFREKLRVEVEYLNPFLRVPVSPGIDTQKIGTDMHLMAQCVGLALRASLTCPMEINLMPPDLVAKRVFRRRQPFFALAIAGVMFILLCWWVYFQKMGAFTQALLTKKLQPKLQALETQTTRMGGVKKQQKDILVKVERITEVVARRTQWIEVLDAVHASMIDGMWIVALQPVVKDDVITDIEISGKGFLDKFVDRPDASAVETFRSKLVATRLFAETTAISRLPLVNSGDFAREFTVTAVLKKPIRLKD